MYSSKPWWNALLCTCTSDNCTPFTMSSSFSCTFPFYQTSEKSLLHTRVLTKCLLLKLIRNKRYLWRLRLRGRMPESRRELVSSKLVSNYYTTTKTAITKKMSFLKTPIILPKWRHMGVAYTYCWQYWMNELSHRQQADFGLWEYSTNTAGLYSIL